MGDGFDIVPLGGDFSLISGDWAKLQSLDIYRKEGRSYGGTNGWRVDPGTVKGICQALDVGVARNSAALLVGLPSELLKKWMAIGERIATRFHEHDMVDLTDEEEGFMWLWVMVVKHENLWLAKMAITINEGMSGNKAVSDQKMRIALDILAKRNPEPWERKNGIMLDNRPALAAPEGEEHRRGNFLGAQGGREDLDAAAREERNKEYEKRKNRGTIKGERQ